MVAAVSAAMGRPFMPHQREIVDVWLEVQSEAAGDPEPGEWAYDDGTALLERRAGKTSLISPMVAHRARLVARASMFMTAQNRDKARARWMDVTEDLLGSVLRDQVRRKVGNMHEELRWPDGGATLKPFAPNEDGLHSETPDLVLVDELWAFSAVEAQAIKAGYVPAFATSSGQALKMSTAGTDRSAWLNEQRRDGRAAVDAGKRLGVFFYEHSLPDRVDVGGQLLRIRQLSDEQLVQACIDHHPAICHVPGCTGPRNRRPCPHGFTVRPAALWSAFTEMKNRSEFLRGFGNRSAADVAALWKAIDEAHWLAHLDGSSIPVSARTALGVWVDEDGDDAAVAAGWRDAAGVMHTEHLRLQDGIRGLPRWVADVCERQGAVVAVPSVKAARDVADELEAAGAEVLRVSQADVAAACSRHRSELRAGTWRSAIAEQATAAAQAAGWHLSRWDRPGESISALGAQTMAGWGMDHAPAPRPRRKFQIR